MKPKLIIANWKCNPTNQKDAKHLFDVVRKGSKKSSAKIIICPPFVYLSQLKGLTLGAQNVFYKESGAFTGQISTLMLKDLNVEYVIVGHSEARKYFAETDQTINQKIKECLNVKLKPILCIGEQAGEEKSIVLEDQLTKALKSVSENYLDNIIIAYEPIWAIGTGKNCSIDETIKSVLIIRHVISNLYSEKSAYAVKILYGGSVTSENSAHYLKESGVSGLLIGGASSNAEEFIKIVKSASFGS